MATQTFETAAANDGFVWRDATTWAGVPSAPVTGRNFFDTSAYAARVYRPASPGIDYGINNILLKWDTSNLPDNATITSASLRVYCNVVLNAQSGSVKCEWYVFDGTDADWSDTITANAHAGLAMSSWPNPGYQTLTLLSPQSNIDKGGMTGIRMHLDIGGATPTGDNVIGLDTNESTTQDAPQLIVNYVIEPTEADRTGKKKRTQTFAI